jgi:hypothetical protein
MADIETLQLNISPQKCFRPFDRSFQRVKYFSCVVDGMSPADLPSEWLIESASGIGFGMQEPTEEFQKEIVEWFRVFTKRWLVRDCVESFALSLDRLCEALMLMGIKRRRIKSGQRLKEIFTDSEAQFIKDFSNAGLTGKRGKVRRLQDEFGIELVEERKKIIRGLKDIRDCLSHRNGVVGESDGEAASPEEGRFHWLTTHLYIEDVKTGIQLPLEVGRVYENGGDVCMQIIQHEKCVTLGNSLRFSSVEAYEIAQSLQWVAQGYLTSANEVMKASGLITDG